MQLWDLDDVLQGSGNTTQAAEADSDSDEMDVDNKGILDFLGMIEKIWWFLQTLYFI